MVMPGRKYSSTSNFRYGFNGKENDNSTGEGNLDFGARVMDVKLGRWLSLDPLQKKYADLSPYNFAGNSPIAFYDPNGKEIIINYKDENGKMQSLKYTPGIKPATNNTFVQQVHEAVSYIMKDDPSKTFQKLSDHKKTVTINEQLSGSSSHDDINKDQTGYINVTVQWGANFGIKTNEGGMAPSTVLLHESGHALGKLNVSGKKELEAAVNSRKRDGTEFTNMEERRVITQIETPYILNKNKSEAKDINNIKPPIQATRNDHYGEYYPTMGVNSITPSDNKTYIPNLQKTFKDEIKPKVDGTYQPKAP
jgi:RHS repeat-associated protein